MAIDLKVIKDREDELAGLRGRMEGDEELVHLADYKLTGLGAKVIPNVVNVTLNKPAVFATNVISSLGATKQQTTVESDDKKFDTHEVEQFLDAAFASANLRLMQKKQPLLNVFADVQNCLRGRSCRRVLFRLKDKKLVSDIASWDTHDVSYVTGEDGFAWASNKTTRSKDEIIAEYKGLEGFKEGNVPEGKELVVREVWDTEVNGLYAGNSVFFEQENPYGFVPVVLEIVPLGYGGILLSKDRLRYEGESIFFMIRGLVPELNRLVSILQTKNLIQIKGPMQEEKKGGGEPADYDEVTAMGANTVVEPGEGFKFLNVADISRSFDLFYPILEKAFQEGSYTDIDIGNVRQPFSAVALITIAEGKDQVFIPRLATRELLNKSTAEMLIRQVLMLKESSVELGVPGHKRKFQTSILKGEFEITYKSFTKSAKSEIARLSMADAAANWYPRKYVYSDVLQVEDSAGMMREWYNDQAELINPIVKTHRTIMNLYELAEKGDEQAGQDASIMAHSLLQSLEVSQVPELEGKVEASPREKLPLLGEGGKVGGIPVQKQIAGVKHE